MEYHQLKWVMPDLDIKEIRGRPAMDITLHNNE